MQLVYEEGFDAGLVMPGDGRNPYPKRTAAYEAWQCGFWDAKPKPGHHAAPNLIQPEPWQQ